MVSFTLAPTDISRFEILFHGNPDDFSLVKNDVIKFDRMLSTTTSEKAANVFTFKNACCKYVFILSNNPAIPYIDINEILDTPFKNQREILLPPNLSVQAIEPPKNFFRKASDAFIKKSNLPNIISRTNKCVKTDNQWISQEINTEKYLVFLQFTD